MSIKGVGQDVAVQRELPQPKIEKPQIEPQKYQAPIENQTRANENAFGSAVVKEALNRLFDKNEAAQTTAITAPEPSFDYNEIDQQADEIINRHTSENIFGKRFDEEAAGRELAEIAKTDPARAAALTDNVFDKIDEGDRNGLAQGFVNNLSSDELRAFARDDNGREVLNQLKDQISGPFWDNNKDIKNRVETAIKAADLEESPEFQRLNEGVRSEILTRITSNEQNAAAVDNLIGLVKDNNFAALPADAQQTMLRAFDNRPEDTVFADALKGLAAEPRFTALTAAQQANVIADMDRFANTESYKGTSGFLGIGGHRPSVEDKRYLLDTIGDVSIYSAENPALTSVRNTLDKVVSGDVKFNAFDEPATDGFITYGYADGNTITLNRNAAAARGIEGVVDTLVHEINHILNGHTDAGTPERFLDEYRAWISGIEASGETIDAETLRGVLDNLGHSPDGAYGHLRDLYNDNAEFRQVIDNAYAGLNETPPRLVDAEQMRQLLLDAGFDSDYLQTTGNLDNH